MFDMDQFRRGCLATIDRARREVGERHDGHGPRGMMDRRALVCRALRGLPWGQAGGPAELAAKVDERPDAGAAALRERYAGVRRQAFRRGNPGGARIHQEPLKVEGAARCAGRDTAQRRPSLIAWRRVCGGGWRSLTQVKTRPRASVMPKWLMNARGLTLALGGCASGGVQRSPASQAPSKKATVARTRADHEERAAWFARDAQLAEDKAEAHREMRDAYASSFGLYDTSGMVGHCTNLIEAYQRAALENAALADSHRRLAVKASE